MAAGPRLLRRARTAAVLVVMATFVVAGMLVPTGGAQTKGDADELLESARTALDDARVSGRIAVEWNEDGATRREEVSIETRRGRFDIDLEHGSSTGDVAARWETGERGARYDGPTGAWEVAWGSTDRAAIPAPDEKYDLRVRRGPKVVGRSSYVVEARRADGVLVERTFVDVEESYLLRREIIESDGSVARTVEFVDLRPASILDALRPGPEPPDTEGRVQAPVDDVPAGVMTPSQVGDGFRLVGRYRQGDDLYQAFYCDGLFTVSVFQQVGELDEAALPEQKGVVRVGDLDAYHFETANGAVYLWERDGVVVTTVADAPTDEVVAVVASLTGDAPSMAERVLDFVLAPFRW